MIHLSKLKVAAALVRSFYRNIAPKARVLPRISSEGEDLLKLIEGLPDDGVVVSAALLSAVRKVKAIGQNPGPHLVILTEDEQKAWDGA